MVVLDAKRERKKEKKKQTGRAEMHMNTCYQNNGKKRAPIA
jgi:hypothetical protein